MPRTCQKDTHFDVLSDSSGPRGTAHNACVHPQRPQPIWAGVVSESSRLMLAKLSLSCSGRCVVGCLVWIWLPECEVGMYGQFSGHHQRDDEDHYVEEAAEFDVISEDDVDDLEDDELR